MTRAESVYLGKVARLGCVACSLLGFDTADTPPEIHHVREGQGMAQRAQHWLAVPLCPECHRGSRGIHGDRGILRQLKCTELDLLAYVISRINA